MKLHENNKVCIVQIIVISVVLTVNYCKCKLLLNSPPNSWLHVYWVWNFEFEKKYIIIIYEPELSCMNQNGHI